jgi:hypothetical protein
MLIKYGLMMDKICNIQHSTESEGRKGGEFWDFFIGVPWLDVYRATSDVRIVTPFLFFIFFIVSCFEKWGIPKAFFEIFL